MLGPRPAAPPRAGTTDDETGDTLFAGGVPAWFNSARTAWGAVRCKYTDIHRRFCDPGDRRNGAANGY